MTADLIAKLEAAESGSRELDLEVAKATGQFWSCADLRDDDGNWFHASITCQNFTTSLDAITALIGEKLPGWFLGLQENRWSKEPEQTERRWSAYLSLPSYDPEEPEIEGTHRDRHIALCIALLRAIQEKADG